MSQGGRLALRYAATRPQRIRTLILQGAVVDGLALPDRRGDEVPIGEYAELAKAGNLNEVRERWMAHPMMRLDSKHVNRLRLLNDIMGEYSGEDLINFEPESFEFSGDVLAAMAEFPRPTLLLTGAHETETRRDHARELLRRIPNCKEVLFRDSGHISNLTEPDRYNKAVIDFCRRAEDDTT